MSLFPMLPDLGDSDKQSDTPQLDWRKALLPAIGSLAVGGSAGGAFLRAFLQGQMVKRETRERQEVREEQKAERRTTRQRQGLEILLRHLQDAKTPEEFAEVKRAFAPFLPFYALEPSVLDTYDFPESKRKAIRKQRAMEKLEQLVRLHGADRIFGSMIDATVTLDGEETTVRELARIAEIAATRKVKQPVTEQISVPRAEEGGLSRFLRPSGETQVQVGEREVTEEIFPGVIQRRTLAEYDARFADTPYARTPVPMTKDGDEDVMALSHYYKLAAIRNPVEAAAERRKLVTSERDDVLKRINQHYANMDRAKTEAVFLGNLQALKQLAANVTKHKPYLGLEGQLRPILMINERAAVADWRQANQKKPHVPQGGDNIFDRQLVLAEAEFKAAEDEKKLLLANPPGKFDRSRAQWENRLRSVNSRILKARAKVEQLRRGRSGGTTPPPTKPDPNQNLDEFYR